MSLTACNVSGTDTQVGPLHHRGRDRRAGGELLGGSDPGTGAARGAVHGPVDQHSDRLVLEPSGRDDARRCRTRRTPTPRPAATNGEPDRLQCGRLGHHDEDELHHGGHRRAGGELLVDCTNGPAPLAVQFTDTSTNTPTAWSWGFGDGATSTVENPSHTYTTAGKYTVSLTASNAGGTNTMKKSNYITVTVPAPEANFSATPTSGTLPLPVQFTDQSTNTPTAWSWNFGDGGSSTLQNPSHTYTVAGPYTVRLTASNAGGANTMTKVLGNATTPPEANFSAAPTWTTASPPVQFTDLSTNTPTAWSWGFGDGGSSTLQNPSHTYATPGRYETVSLTATNAGGADTMTKTNYITVAVTAPEANFSATPTWATAGIPVQFTDQSTNTPTAWSWSFGDGGSSTLQNPSHTYAAAGQYETVSLTASNVGGANTMTKANYITVAITAPEASFSASPTSGTHPLPVKFTDASTNTPTSWKWTFGDGGTATTQNPSHTYSAAGSYTVSLTATNGGGANTLTKAGCIKVT